MKNRLALVEDLILINRPLKQLALELHAFSWDYDGAQFPLLREHLSSVLSKYVEGQMAQDSVEEWANLVEGRDDVSYEEDRVADVLHELANPVLTQALSLERANDLIKSLRTDEAA